MNVHLTPKTDPCSAGIDLHNVSDVSGGFDAAGGLCWRITAGDGTVTTYPVREWYCDIDPD